MLEIVPDDTDGERAPSETLTTTSRVALPSGKQIRLRSLMIFNVRSESWLVQQSGLVFDALDPTLPFGRTKRFPAGFSRIGFVECSAEPRPGFGSNASMSQSAPGRCAKFFTL